MTASFPRHSPKIALVAEAHGVLGQALVRRLVEKGLRVGALGTDGPELAALARAGEDGQVLLLPADLGDPEAVTRAFEKLDETFGPLDTLINNTKEHPQRDFLEETPETFMHTMAINLGGPMTCSLRALERMVPRGTGRIVDVATFAGTRPTYLSSAYSVSKGAARILTMAMIKDLADRFPDIVITEWVPGPMNTEVPEGCDPQEAARWGVALALWHDPRLTGAVFDKMTELLPPVSAKRRVLAKLTGRRRKPRRLVV